MPRNTDWRQEAWERLSEAKAIVLAPRDRSPEELEIWVNHLTTISGTEKSLADILPNIHTELVEKGFIEKGSWDSILKDTK